MINFSGNMAELSRKSISPVLEVSVLSKSEEFNIVSVTLASNKTIEVKEYSDADVVLLAKLIQAEALSETYEGKVAVGSVVVNRMKSFNATLQQVLYAENQFSGINGRLFKQEPSEECKKAALEALDGKQPVGEAMYFLDLNEVRPSWLKNVEFIKRIGEHWFYKRK
jgi:spore germination cell wall hydrolase CwlJ-like protein